MEQKNMTRRKYHVYIIFLLAFFAATLAAGAGGESAAQEKPGDAPRMTVNVRRPGGADGADPVMTFEKGVHFSQLQDYESAEQCFAAVCREHPNSQIFPQASLYWGRTLIMLKREKEALALWDDLFARKQYYGNRYDLFRLYQQFGLLEQKLEAFRKNAAANAADYQAQSDYVELLVFMNRADEAVTQYQAMLRANPANYHINKSIGDLLSRFRRHREAVVYYEELLRRDPANEIYLDAAANAWFQAGETAKAKALWSKIIENTTEWNRYNFLANIYQNHGMVTEAVEIYAQCQAKSNNPTLFFAELAELYEIGGDFGKMMSMYFRIIDGTPELSPAIENRVAETVKRNEDSRGPLCEIVERSAGEIVRSNEKMRIATLILLGSKKFAGALEMCFRQAEAAGSPAVAEEFADTLFLLGEKDLALKCLSRIMEKYSGTETEYRARYRAGVFLAEKGDYGKAMDAFRAVSKNAGFSGLYFDSLYNMALITLDRLKKPKEAIPQLRELARAGNQFSEKATYDLARACLYTGDFGEAGKMAEKVEKLPGDFPQKAKALAAYSLLYEGTYEAAMEAFHDLVADNPSIESAHEYLGVMAIIRENAGANEALKKYFDSYRSYLGGEFATAETLVAGIETGESTLAARAALLDARIKLQTGRSGDFAKKGREIIAARPGSDIAAEALFELGNYYSDIAGDKRSAVECFDEILKKYPNCLLTNKARERLKKLDGGANVEKKRRTFFAFD